MQERALDDEPGTPPFGGTVAPMKFRVCPYCALRLWSIKHTSSALTLRAEGNNRTSEAGRKPASDVRWKVKERARRVRV
ncbi:hypothetical protein L209DRAFT_38702 [Thermothelomyces heterothallicus CBS 203.75]